MLLFFSQLSSVLGSNLSWYPQWHDQVTRTASLVSGWSTYTGVILKTHQKLPSMLSEHTPLFSKWASATNKIEQ